MLFEYLLVAGQSCRIDQVTLQSHTGRLHHRTALSHAQNSLIRTKPSSDLTSFKNFLVASGAVAGVALRAVQVLFLEQTVPFTYRRHTVILPVGIELLMGDLTFKQQVTLQQVSICSAEHCPLAVTRKLLG